MQTYHVYYTCTYIKITDDQGMVCFLFRKFQGDNVSSYKRKKLLLAVYQNVLWSQIYK